MNELEELATRRKQGLRHEDFRRLWSAARNLVDAERLESLTARTLEEIERACKGRAAAYAWSGGKDSLVLEHLCAQVGITEGVLVITELEVPAFLRWATDAMPDGLSVVKRPLDLPWLAGNSSMLFPCDHTVARRWFRLVQHAGQRSYYRSEHLDLLLLGRRRVDGNYIPTLDGVYESQGITRYAPLRDWNHAEIFAYLQTWQIDLPPTYDWPRGFRVGTGPWPARQWCATWEDGWREVFAIDPGVVQGAAEYLNSARAFLDRRF